MILYDIKTIKILFNIANKNEESYKITNLNKGIKMILPTIDSYAELILYFKV